MNYFGLFFTFTLAGIAIGMCGGWVLGVAYEREERRRRIEKERAKRAQAGNA